MVFAANLFPANGLILDILKQISKISVGFLFFLHGTKLSKNAILSGFTHWKMHLLILSITFLFFPFFGFSLKIFQENLLKPDIYYGFLFLCSLPSTLQSSIVFTSIARGNVAGAIGAASVSTLLGIFISPLWIFFFLGKSEVLDIQYSNTFFSLFVQMIFPFLLGFLFQRKVAIFFQKSPKLTKFTDYFSVLLIIYCTFSQATNDKIWSIISVPDLLLIIGISLILLLISLWISMKLSRIFKFSKEDEISIVFCGSKKSMISGIPIASILFSSSYIGIFIIPLLIFHQIQLIICSVIAQKYAQRTS